MSPILHVTMAPSGAHSVGYFSRRHLEISLTTPTVSAYICAGSFLVCPCPCISSLRCAASTTWTWYGNLECFQLQHGCHGNGVYVYICNAIQHCLVKPTCGKHFWSSLRFATELSNLMKLTVENRAHSRCGVCYRWLLAGTLSHTCNHTLVEDASACSSLVRA